MIRVRIVMWWVTLAGVAALAVAIAPARGSAGGDSVRLTASGDELGWISLVVRGPDDARVELRELQGAGSARIAILTLRSGSSERPRAARWRCDRRTRRFTVRTLGADVKTAAATITTPSCEDRLRMIVVPGHVRPGQAVSVRVSDTWRLGGIAATICARPAADATPCRRVSLPSGARTRRARVTLTRPGERTITLRSEFGQRVATPVDVRPGARVRVLVTGDSLIGGMSAVLAADLGDRATVVDDSHPGRGITTPGGFLDWSAHARRVSRTERPDVTIVVLGSADGGYPLAAASGEPVPCCEPQWVSAYAVIASGMMTSFLRDGRGLVYWVLLPAPRSPLKARVLSAENDAVREAGGDHADGVRVIERVAGVLSPGNRFVESISVDGREVVVRDPDGVHLTVGGIRIAIDILKQSLLADGLLE